MSHPASGDVASRRAGADALSRRVRLGEPARRRAEREEHAAELSADVGRLLDAEPVAAYRENVLEKVSRWVSKNRFLVLLVLAYLLMRIFFIFTARN